MNDDIGLAILEELRKQNEILYKQNEMLNFQAKVLSEILEKSINHKTLLTMIATILVTIHDVDLSKLGYDVNKKDSENE
jgi:hypothetical protein